MFDSIWFLLSERDSKTRSLKIKLSAEARKGNVKAMGDLAKICRETGDYATSIKWYTKIVELAKKQTSDSSWELNPVCS
mgnify:CR=1 FL=1